MIEKSEWMNKKLNGLGSIKKWKPWLNEQTNLGQVRIKWEKMINEWLYEQTNEQMNKNQIYEEII